ncbi:hypothetical protein [Oscillatoria sp. FACHB-1406]|uniref:tetratricopeptide repeat protein n=1 Tax=Oscillatoria sp. FACHB-1406 TaxID=2692846 RepID=UPI001685D23F|nr:hypothetical protein [Oscillatoria sp. FACHB-1406]MBD2580239.1 hypothetical protein [Oscillatoria sp. FACHB-1406]
MTYMAIPTVMSLNETANWVEKGKRFFEAGFYQEALMEFGKALQLQPDDCDTWVLQAAALTHLDDYSAALMSLESALKYASYRSSDRNSEYDLQSIYLFRGVVLRELEQHRKAYANFNRALKPQAKRGRSFWQMLTQPFQTSNQQLIPRC